MFRQISDFIRIYRESAEGNLKLLQGLSDAGLTHRCTEGHRSAGEVAWHIVQTIPEMASFGEVYLGAEDSGEAAPNASSKPGLKLDRSVLSQPVPASAAEIVEAYRRATSELLAAVERNMADEDLLIEDNMYGETWQRGYTLFCLYAHEIHHFGQLTVLLRAAGLPVHGRFGPSKEEWAQYGMEQPAGLA